MTRCNDQSWPAIDFRSPMWASRVPESHMFPSTYRMTQLVRPWTWVTETTAANQSLRDFRASAELNSRYYFLIIQVAISRLGRVVESWKMPTFLCFPVAWETDETGSQGQLALKSITHSSVEVVILYWSRRVLAAVSQKCWELANHPAIIPDYSKTRHQTPAGPAWLKDFMKESSPKSRTTLAVTCQLSSSPRIQRISYENEAKTQKMLHWTWGGTYLDGTYLNLSSCACHPI